MAGLALLPAGPAGIVAGGGVSLAVRSGLLQPAEGPCQSSAAKEYPVGNSSPHVAPAFRRAPCRTAQCPPEGGRYKNGQNLRFHTLFSPTPAAQCPPLVSSCPTAAAQ